MSTAERARAVDRAVFPNTQGGPFMHAIAAKAVAFQEALQPEFKAYAAAIVQTARALASTLGAGGLRIVSGGTENHLVLLDVSPLGIDGSQAEEALRQAGIIANKNAIPFDPLPPRVTSGLRLGTPAIASRGMGVDEMANVGEFVLDALRAVDDSAALVRIRRRVVEFARVFPAPGVTDG
jgi:glycine hydroxymethyltransferase